MEERIKGNKENLTNPNKAREREKKSMEKAG